jgi:hypothetical protein
VFEPELPFVRNFPPARPFCKPKVGFCGMHWDLPDSPIPAAKWQILIHPLPVQIRHFCFSFPFPIDNPQL